MFFFSQNPSNTLGSHVSRSLCSLPNLFLNQFAAANGPELIRDRGRIWRQSLFLGLVRLRAYERERSRLDTHQLGARLLSRRRDERRRHSGATRRSN